MLGRRGSYRWTTLIHATLHISDVTDKCISWLSNITFDWRHVMEMAVESNNQTHCFITFFALYLTRFRWKLHKWATSWQNQQNDYAPSEDSDQPGQPPSVIRILGIHQVDQSLCCALSGLLRTQAFLMRTAKTLIRPGRCPGWSESSLGTQTILLVLSWGGSNNEQKQC